VRTHDGSEGTIAAADGSCLGNPGPGGWGWVTADGRTGSAGARQTTNNRMELRAVLELLNAVPDNPIVVQTDSAYVVGIFTEWLEGWRERGMRKPSGKPVGNQDLIEAIAEVLETREVTFEKVRGHSGHALNDAADALARSAAEAARQRLRDEPRGD